MTVGNGLWQGFMSFICSGQMLELLPLLSRKTLRAIETVHVTWVCMIYKIFDVTVFTTWRWDAWKLVTYLKDPLRTNALGTHWISINLSFTKGGENKLFWVHSVLQKVFYMSQFTLVVTKWDDADDHLVQPRPPPRMMLMLWMKVRWLWINSDTVQISLQAWLKCIEIVSFQWDLFNSVVGVRSGPVWYLHC